MRLLWARVGVPYSPATGLPIVSQTVSQMVDRVHGDAGGHAALSAGADRARPQGRVPQGARRPAEARVSAGQDRRQDVRARRGAGRSTRTSSTTSRSSSTGSSSTADLGNRLADSFETALDLADGIAITENADIGRGDDLLGEIRLPGLGLYDPRDRAAAVLVQQPVRRLPGLRRARHQALFRPRSGRARPRAAASPRARSARGRIRRSPYYTQTLESIARHFRKSMHTPWRDLPEKMRRTILYGSDGEPIKMTYDDGLRKYTTDAAVRGRACRTWSGASARPTAPGCSEELGPLPERQDLRGVRRRPAQARGAGGQDRRQAHQRGRRRCRSPRPATGSPASTRR